MKKLFAILLASVIIAVTLAGCNESADVSATTKSTTESTTTTTTTTRTTEDINTTFKEAATASIYPALNKDANGSYPYKLSTYTTYYDSSNSTRTVNINNAVSKLDDIKIPDGSTFSFNQTVGKRTVLAGYQEAKVVVGDEFVDGLGGGICQVSSTIFQAALRANLDIKVRACHSLEISYVPLGADATVQWNTQDFQFKNNSGTDLRMSVSASKGTLTCSIYAADDIDVGKVDINVSKDGNSYVLKRSVDGKVNYTTYSKYNKPKPSTTAKTTTKKAETTTKKAN
ncbi:MAG: VanW family protein [Eubacterium sp.]|nr:VanW family protein [Eubacterium sp.]